MITFKIHVDSEILFLSDGHSYKVKYINSTTINIKTLIFDVYISV